MAKYDSFDGRDAISQSTIKTLVYEFFFPNQACFFYVHAISPRFPRESITKILQSSLSLSFSSEKSLFRIETNSERTILILPSFFFCDFNIITKTSCGEVNTKDRNSFKRILTSLFIRLYKNNPSHRISERKKKFIKIDRANSFHLKILPRNRNQSITRNYSFIPIKVCPIIQKL